MNQETMIKRVIAAARDSLRSRELERIEDVPPP